MFYISRIKVNRRKIIESINTGETMNEVAEIIAGLWEGKVIEIRELSEEETEIVKSGLNIKF